MLGSEEMELKPLGVDSLDIEELNLNGKNLEEITHCIFALENLRVLRLDENRLTMIPVGIGKLSHLTKLYLRGNRLISIPDEFNTLTNLEVLDLDDNQLTDIPDLGRLSKLAILGLRGNQLESIPDFIWSLSDLKQLWLQENRLKQSIPDGISRLTNLEMLALGGNQIRIPDAIGGLSNLTALWLNHTHLSVNEDRLEHIPSGISTLTNLERLYLDGNKLETISDWIGELSSLSALRLNDNQLKSLPTDIGKLSNLWGLWLQHNAFASIPGCICGMSNLSSLSLTDNNLTSIPESISGLSNLTRLWLSNNEIAEISDGFGELSNLGKLGLDNNKLTSISDYIGGLSNLTVFRVHQNELKSISPDIGKLSNLTRLHLDRNKLESIPGEIGKLTNLAILRLGENKLESIPDEIGSLENLLELDLHGNELKGIPEAIGGLSRLTKLWLNKNQLARIPDAIVGLSNLTELYLHVNKLESIPKGFEEMTNLMILSLDENQSKIIPENSIIARTNPVELYRHQEDQHKHAPKWVRDMKIFDWREDPEKYSKNSHMAFWMIYRPKFERTIRTGWNVALPTLSDVLGEIYRWVRKDEAVWIIAQLQRYFYKTVTGLNEKKRQYIMSGSPISLESVVFLEWIGGSLDSSSEHDGLYEEHIRKVMRWWKPDFKLEEVECEEGDKLGQGGFGSVYPFKWEGVDCAIKIWSFDRTFKKREEEDVKHEKKKDYEGTPKMKEEPPYDASRERRVYHKGEKKELVELHSAISKTMIDDDEQKEQIERIKQVLEIGAMVFLQTFLPHVTKYVIELKGVVKTRDGKIGVVMEKASTSLKNWIVKNEEKNVGLKTRLCIVYQIARCLELLHGGFALQICGKVRWEGSVIHGDLHSGNVLLMEGSGEDTADGITVKLCDFGLCKILTKKQPSLEFNGDGTTYGSTYGVTRGLTRNPKLPLSGFSRSLDVKCFGILMYQVLMIRKASNRGALDKILDKLPREDELLPSLSDMVRRCLRDEKDGVRMEDVRAELENIDEIAKEWGDWLGGAREKARENEEDEEEKMVRELKRLETMNGKGEWLRGRIPETEEKPYLMDVVDLAVRSGEEKEFLISLGRIDPSGEGPEDWFSSDWEEVWEDEKEYFWEDFREMEKPLEARIFEFVHMWDLQTEDILEKVEELFRSL